MKTYFNPTTEIVEIEAMRALCDSVPNTDVSGDPDPRNAPQRQVF